LLKGYFPAQWKVAQIILILKPIEGTFSMLSLLRLYLLWEINGNPENKHRNLALQFGESQI
jgi:hypothetical protein